MLLVEGSLGVRKCFRARRAWIVVVFATASASCGGHDGIASGSGSQGRFLPSRRRLFGGLFWGFVRRRT